MTKTQGYLFMLCPPFQIAKVFLSKGLFPLPFLPQSLRISVP
jgi:hypothetical protein